MAAPAFGAVDNLVLSTGWEPQGSSPALGVTRAMAAGSNGDVVAENGHNDTESGTTTYIYTGTSTAFIAALNAASAWPGNLVDTNTLFVTGIAIDYSPCAEGKKPQITFTWRDGPTAAPAVAYEYVTDVVLPTYYTANIDVPDLLSITPGSAELQTTDWALTCQLGEDLDSAGDFLDGDGFGGEETINMTFTGLPTSITSTGWIQTAGPAANAGGVVSNTGYDTYSYSFMRKVTRS